MKRFSLFVLVLASILCLAAFGVAEGISTPTDVDCEHFAQCTSKNLCDMCGSYLDSNTADVTITHPTSSCETVYDTVRCKIKCNACGELWFNNDTHLQECGALGVCRNCGLTNVNFPDIEHNWDEWQYDDSKHWAECSECGEIFNEGEHGAWCDEPGSCWNCGAEYTGQSIYHYVWSSETGDNWYSDETGHWYECLVCLEKVSPTYEHTWELTNETSPTCTEWGKNEYTCDTCGETKTEDVEYLGHSYVYTIEDMMHIGVCEGCGEEGDRGQHFGTCVSPTTCDVCGATEAEVTIVDSTHEYGTNYEYDDKQHWFTCHACGEKVSTGNHWSSCDSPDSCIECGASGITADVGHFGEYINCTETTHQHHCVECGELGEVELHEEFCWDAGYCYICGSTGVTMSRTIHYSREVQFDDSEHWEYCDGCDQEISAREAHYDDCAEPDGKCDKCESACGEEALTHVWKEDSVTEATCTSDGVRTYICENCDGIKEEIFAEATDHVWGEPVTVDATCTTDGSKTTACTKCDAKTVEAIKSSGHAWDKPVTVAATCTTDGSKTTVCTKCDAKTVETIKSSGHAWDKPVTVAATCTTDGSKTTACTACNEKTVEIIAAEGHMEETILGQAATCAGTGLTDGKICSVCDKVIAEQSIIPAKGHNRVKDEGVEPTADADGLTEGYHCSWCGAVLVKQEIIPATGNASIPMTELEIFLDQMLEQNQHDNRGDNVPNNGKDFEIPLTKSGKEDKGIVLHVYRESNETYNAVGLSVSFKEDVTEEIAAMQDEATSISKLRSDEKIAGFVEYVRNLVVTLSPEKLDDGVTDELVLEILKNITVTDKDFDDLIAAFVDGELDKEQRTVIRDGYEYFLVSDGKTLSLSVRKIEE